MTEPVAAQPARVQTDVLDTGQMDRAPHIERGARSGPGDLIASGTVSGPEKEQWRLSAAKLTAKGNRPVRLPMAASAPSSKTATSDSHRVLRPRRTSPADRPRHLRGVVLSALRGEKEDEPQITQKDADQTEEKERVQFTPTF